MSQKFGEVCACKIKVDVGANKNIAEIMITDYGGGLPQEVKESLNSVTFDDILLQERGRGLLLVNSLTDSFECSVGPDGAAIYKIIKRRNKKCNARLNALLV